MNPWLILVTSTMVATAGVVFSQVLTLLRELSRLNLTVPARKEIKREIRALNVVAGMFFAIAVVIVATT